MYEHPNPAQPSGFCTNSIPVLTHKRLGGIPIPTNLQYPPPFRTYKLSQLHQRNAFRRTRLSVYKFQASDLLWQKEWLLEAFWCDKRKRNTLNSAWTNTPSKMWSIGQKRREQNVENFDIAPRNTNYSSTIHCVSNSEHLKLWIT